MKKLLLCASLGLMLAGCEATQPTIPSRGKTMALTTSAATTQGLDGQPGTDSAKPMKLGVVELDEVAPSVAILDRLRGRADLFSRVQPLPGGGCSGDDKSPGTVTDRMSKLGPALASMREQAAGQGLDTLLVLGNDVNTRSNDTLLGVFDLTIVGIWVVPSRQVLGDGRGLAELVDVRTGKVLSSESADQSDWAFVPAIAAADAQQNVRLAVVAKMNDRLIARIVAATGITLRSGANPL